MKVSVAICACMIAVCGVTAVAAHGHGHEGNESKKKHPHEHGDNGRHVANGHHKFDDRDREIAHNWCYEHRDRLPVGFRDVDRLPAGLDAQLKVGVVLNLELRNQIHPLPTDLLRQLPAPPIGVKYIAIGGHVGLIDTANRLHDLLPRPPLPF